MPKLEPKQIQKELEQGQLWPVYWLYGQERMKSRELLKRIRAAALGSDGAQAGLGALGFGEENFEGSETTGPAIVDAALSPGLGGGTRFVVVREAQAIKEADGLGELLTHSRGKKGEIPFVCVFLSRDLDARKKISKLLVEKAAVVPCEEVAEAEREAWIRYLAKRRGMEISPVLAGQLVALDPWNLDIVDQELEKVSLSGGEDEGGGSAVTLAGSSLGGGGGSDVFLDAFFSRNLKQALLMAETFADQPDEALPLLGLFSWNVRQVALVVSDRERGTRHAKLNPYVAEKVTRWSRAWGLGELQELQSELAALDHGFKQTPLLPLGLWTSLILKFGNPS